LVLLDTETTGQEVETARIVEYGHRVFKPDTDVVVDYYTLINPEIPIPKEVAEVHGISDALIAIGCARCKRPAEEHPNEECESFKLIPRFRDIAHSLAKGFANADFAGANLRRYDLPLLAKEFERCGILFDYSQAAILDVQRLEQLLEPRTVSDLYKKYTGQEFQDAHCAIIDVRGTERVLLGQLSEHPRRSIIPRTPREIHELSYPRDPDWVDSEGKFVFIDGEPCFNFGKHKGRPLKSAISYLEWMIGGSFSPELKAIVNRALKEGIWPKKETV
jgi:DNA polymerase III subunit epsilon